MAVKTFGSEILTSSDTNTFLANSGLVYVTSATIGSAVSSVTLSSCFNSTYTAYKIVVAGGTTSADANLGLKLGASTTGYYAAKPFIIYSTGGAFNVADNNAAQWTQTGFSINGQGMSMSVELQNPFLAQFTYMQCSVNAATLGGMSSGIHQVATSYNSITITPSAGTMTGGTVTVYGYRLG
jgi:hypothetical protein